MRNKKNLLKLSDLFLNLNLRMNITCNRKERIKLFAYDIVNLPFDNTSEANFGKMNQHGAVTRAHCKFKRSLSTQSANLDVVTNRLILPLFGSFWSQSGV